MPRLLCAPLPLCWVAFTTMRWKCDTVRWNSCLGLCRAVEVCVTYFQRLLAAPRTAAEDCYDSFPLRAQESIFSPWHFYSSSVTLIFPFSTDFFSSPRLSFTQPRFGFGAVGKVVKSLFFFFWITLGRCNYSVLWNLHTISGNRAADYPQTDISKTPFDAISVPILFMWVLTALLNLQ